MGQSTTDVKREIEQTREDMSGTIDAIADRTSPSRVLGRQRRRMADRVRSVRSHVMGTAEQAVGTTQEAMHGAREGTGQMADSLRGSAGQVAENVREVPGQARQVVRDQTQGNPLAAGVIAFGTGLLAAYLVPSSPIERRVTKQVRQEAEPVLTELKEAGQDVAGNLKDTAEQAVQEVQQTATDSARQVADEAKDKAREVRDDAASRTETVTDQAPSDTP